MSLRLHSATSVVRSSNEAAASYSPIINTNLSQMVRTLVQQVETNGQTISDANAVQSSCRTLVEMLQLCFLSNPLLWRNKQYVGNGGYTLLEMLMETVLSRFTFTYSPRRGMRMDAFRATAELLTRLIQLLLLQPPVHWFEWRHMDQHLLQLCAAEVTRRSCTTSAEMLVMSPPDPNDLAEIKQLRWNVVRLCSGGPFAHGFSRCLCDSTRPSLPLLYTRIRSCFCDGMAAWSWLRTPCALRAVWVATRERRTR